MSKPLPRLSSCPRCNGPVEITFEYWQPGYLAHDVNWVCPLCAAPVTLGITGRVLSVTTRDPQGPWLMT
jgi:hypothetical protein